MVRAGRLGAQRVAKRGQQRRPRGRATRARAASPSPGIDGEGCERGRPAGPRPERGAACHWGLPGRWNEGE
eukprot:10842741-Alexandrium_andersonii.AAC.1